MTAADSAFSDLPHLVLSQRRVVFVCESGFDERRQRLRPPLSHSGVWMLADLKNTTMHGDVLAETDLLIFSSNKDKENVTV